MSELPPAEAATDIVDVNARTAKSQYMKWLAMFGVLAVIAVVFFYHQLKSPARVKNNDDPERILATADTGQGAELSPEASAAELHARNTELEQQLAVLQGENVQLKSTATDMAGQLQADRADAERTIAVLERSVSDASSNRSPAPVGYGPTAQGGAAPLSQGEAAPPPSPYALGPNPFAGPGGMVPGGTGSPGGAAPSRPKRSMGTIRVSNTRGGDAAAPSGAQSSASPTEDVSQGSSRRGDTDQYKDGAGLKYDKESQTYISGTLQTFDSARYVPPNAYATARVLVGVDSAAGVQNTADPKPVLFRIMGPAVSVGANGRFQTTDLRGCQINGAANSELASEKVYIKLQRITCPNGPGKFSVATVEGYVVHKGKAGVRGRVISREGNLTRRAMIAGTLQGLGGALSTNLGRVGLGRGGGGGGGGLDSLLGQQKLSTEEVATGALGQGVSNAASLLADYYIKRAEQYQPVIEMPTGIDVEIVFLSGFQIKGD